VEGTVFPVCSFGPLAHVLSKLISSDNRGVATFAARAVKNLLLDDALRPQACAAGLPLAIVKSLQRWKGEVLCLRELLGGLQTVLWDRQSAQGICTSHSVEVSASICEALDSSDFEVVILALGAMSNLLAFADSLLLAKDTTISALGRAMPKVLKLATGRDRSQKCYASAALANATSHPVLAALLTECGGLGVLQEIERETKANLSIGGTRVAEFAGTAVLRLTGSKEVQKFRFKFGNKAVLGINIDPQTHRSRLQVCAVIWVLCIVLLFRPLIFSHRRSTTEGTLSNP
jgi:hypothetical protein